MKGITFEGVQTVHCAQLPDPEIIRPGDAVVRVSLAGVCGSDLHVFHGREKGCDCGTVMGHEFVGEIVETGREVRRFRTGDLVFSPFTTSCGACYYCKIGLTARCEKGKLYGWRENGQGLHGGQAEFVRVPMADTTLIHLTSDLSPEQGLLLGDIFSTGYFCADMAGISRESAMTCAVVGCGPVGLMAILGAIDLGAARVFALDTIPERLAKATAFGAIPINVTAPDFQQTLREATAGRGVDAALEAVGSSAALRLAVDLVRPGGTVSSVGVHTSEHFPFSPVEAYNKNLTYRIGRCPARFYAEKLIRESAVQRLDIASVITHRYALADGAEAYRVFDQKVDDCLKAVLVC